MKKAKRILAVLLTAVLAFTILTGCGGGNGGNGGNGSNTSYPASSTVKNSVVSTLKQAGFSASPDEQALNAISEKYAKQISKSPDSYSSYGSNASSSPLSQIQSAWANDCQDAFTTSRIYTLRASSPYAGSNSEADAASYYANSLSSMISYFKQAISDKGPGTSYYFVYPVHITNPSDSEDSVWIMFTFLYYVQN